MMNQPGLAEVISSISQQLARGKNNSSSHEENKVACDDRASIINPDELQLNQIDEAVFRNFIESIPVLIYVICGSKFIYFNPAFVNALGYSRMELQNMNFLDVAHPDFKELILQRNQARQRGDNPPQQYEIKAVSKSGEERWLELFHSITTMDGETTIVVGAIDITEKKRIQENLELSEARYRAVVEDQTEMILRISPDKKITFINEAAIRYLKFQKDDFTGTFYLPEAFQRFRDQLDPYIDLLGPDKPALTFEKNGISANGSEVWNEWDIRAIMNEKDVPREYQIVGRDITERKMASEELKKARDELENQVIQRTAQLSKANQELTSANDNLNNIIQNMSDGVIVINQKYEIEMSNPAFKKTWGDMEKDIELDLKNNIIGGKGQYINKMLKEKAAFRDEEIIFTTNRGDMPFFASGTPIIDDAGEVKSGLIILRPINEIHKLVNRFSGARAKFHFDDIIVQSNNMLDVIRRAKMEASSKSNILIEGESGTGKELFAQAIHNHGQRKNGPFVAVNCGAIPRELIGSELFGYAEGAFTGAKKGGNPGKFELAAGGTIFLDEIGDMPFDQQAVLLRVIQEKAITRIGGSRLIPVNVRIVCATNKNLLNEIEKGNFRQDLYYRINVISLKIPPLRERREDIPVLFEHFVANAKAEFSCGDISNQELLHYLIHYNWPGNVRELQNVVERMVNMAGRTKLGIEHLPAEIYAFSQADGHSYTSPPKLEHHGELKNIDEVKTLLVDMERNKLVKLLNQYRGNVSKVAKELGVSRNTIYRKISDYNIDR